MDGLDGAFLPATELLAEATRLAASFAERLRDSSTASKKDATPVTAADIALQAILVRGLRERYGNNEEFVGEESTAVFAGDGGGALRELVYELVRSARPSLSAHDIDDAIDAGAGDGTAARQWVLDPIDGTRGYLRGQQYCVCLARLESGLVRYGGAGCPRLTHHGSIFAATRGGGAWEWMDLAMSKAPRRLHASNERRTPLVAIESADVSERARRRLRILADCIGGGCVTRALESQCKFVLVATGDADLTVRFPSRNPAHNVDMIWDYAGAVVLAEEAGARMTDCRGEALRFGAGRAIEKNYGVLCAASWLHSSAIERFSATETAIEDPSGSAA